MEVQGDNKPIVTALITPEKPLSPRICVYMFGLEVPVATSVLISLKLQVSPSPAWCLRVGVVVVRVSGHPKLGFRGIRSS